MSTWTCQCGARVRTKKKNDETLSKRSHTCQDHECNTFTHLDHLFLLQVQKKEARLGHFVRACSLAPDSQSVHVRCRKFPYSSVQRLTLHPPTPQLTTLTIMSLLTDTIFSSVEDCVEKCTNSPSVTSCHQRTTSAPAKNHTPDSKFTENPPLLKKPEAEMTQLIIPMTNTSNIAR